MKAAEAQLTVEQLTAWTRHTEVRLRGARAQLAKHREDLAALSRSERRSRAGAALVGRIETVGAIVAQLEHTIASVRDQLGLEPIEEASFTSVEDLTGCDCERKPAKIGGGLVEVVWNPKCKLHGVGT